MRFRSLVLVLALLCAPALASVSTTATSQVYAGNGTTTAFAVPFPFFSSSDLSVTFTVNGVTSSAGAYSVSGGSDATGTVTFATAPVAGTTITITRSTPYTQSTSFQSQGSFSPKSHEQAFDKITLALQDEGAARSTLATKEATDVSTLLNSIALLNGNSHAPNDTASILAFGSTTARTLTTRFAERFNIKDYGAVGDGVTDDTAAFTAALAAISSAGGGELYIPAATYLISTVTSLGSAIAIPANATIQGDGRKSIIKLAAVSSNGLKLAFKFTGDNITLRNFQLDGNKGAAAGGLTTVQVFGFCKGITNAEDRLVVEDVWAHDLLGVANESFWVTLHVPGITANSQLTGAMTNVVFRRLRGWNNGGTPFHVNGYIDDANLGNVFGGFMTDGVTVDDVEAWNNDDQGISMYGAKNVVVMNSNFHGNHIRGINMEWSDNVHLKGNVSNGNWRAGIGSDGLVNYLAENNHVYGNNTQNGTGPAPTDGEFTAYSGTWFLGSPAPSSMLGTAVVRNNKVEPLALRTTAWAPNTGYAIGQYVTNGGNIYYCSVNGTSAGSGGPTGVASGNIIDNTVTWLYVPYSTGRHFYFDRNTSINVGDPVPASITLDQPDVDQWVVGSASAVPLASAVLHHQGGPSPLHTVGLGQLISLTPSSGAITVGAYGGTGNFNAGAVSLTTSTVNASASTPGVFRPGRTYRLRTRIKAEDTVTEWLFILKEADGGTNQFSALSHNAVSSQTGSWKTVDITFTINNLWQVSKLSIQRSAATGASSTLDVDYVNVEELASTQSLSEAPTWAGRVVGRGTAAPTTGTWRRGDLWMNDTPTNLGDLAWVCTTAGTPGTWTQLSSSPILSGVVQVQGAAGTNREVDFYNTTTSVQPRWLMRTNSTAEGGANAGSDFDFMARSDAGAALFTAWHATRSTGVVNFPQGLQLGGGYNFKAALSSTATWDPPSIAAGAQAVDGTPITLTGAALGDTCHASFSLDTQGLRAWCYVSATNTVQLAFSNNTGGAIDLGSGTFRVDIWQH